MSHGLPKWDTIIYEKKEEIARITLNRPDVRNALDDRLIEEVHEALYEADLDEDIRVIIVAGAGPSFSSGHDLNSPEPHREGGGRPALAREMQTRLRGPERLLKREQHIYYDKSVWHRNLRTPTIAEVQGWCVAGGLMLAAMCDLIVASDDAQFSNPVLRMTNGAVEILVEPWELGPRRAKEFLWTGDPISADEAHQIGLVNRVVPRDQLQAATEQLARRIALTPQAAVELVKKSINHTMDIMGQTQSWEAHFMAHNWAHWSQESFDLSDEMSTSELSTRAFISKRDERYRNDLP